VLHKYWFEFELPPSMARTAGCGPGCGVTAFSYEDALALVKERIFNDGEIPPVRNCIEDVDVSTLDAERVQPNMDIPFFRGVWYPKMRSR
jgi:hypothetical protein